MTNLEKLNFMTSKIIFPFKAISIAAFIIIIIVGKNVIQNKTTTVELGYNELSGTSKMCSS